MKLYVKAKSKKEINERLSAGDQVLGVNFSIFGDGGTYGLETVADGTVIAVFEKEVSGSPYAKSYGTWNAKKQRVA
jgi:hypothetical protein